MKVALVDIPNMLARESKTEVPSLSLGYLAAILLSAGHEVMVLDTQKWRLSYENAYQQLIKDRPQVIGFTCTTKSRFSTIDLIRKLKKDFSFLSVVGGPHFTFSAWDALEKVEAIDIVVRGEGEETILEVLDDYSTYREYSTISGISYRNKKGKIIENKDRQFISDLDKLPLPAWKLFDLSLYDDKLEDSGLRAIGIISGRGCPQRCSFCANSVMGRAELRLRNPILVVDEIEMLHKQFGYKAFKFSDDTLTINKNHIINICKEIIRRNLDIKWSARVRVNTVDKERLEYMKKAGCISLFYGVESGSREILKKMHKEISIDQVKKAITMSSSMGFEVVGAGFMVSYPGETFNDLDCNFKLMNELKNYGSNVRVTYGFTIIYPGTEVEKIAKEEGILSQDFSWNSYYRAPKYFIAQCEETDVYFEAKKHNLEKIRAYISSNYYSFSGNIKRILFFLRRINSLKDLLVLIHLAHNAIRFLFRKAFFTYKNNAGK